MLAVFEEVHVHEVLYILVFGESVLNGKIPAMFFPQLPAAQTTKLENRHLYIHLVILYLSEVKIWIMNLIGQWNNHLRVLCMIVFCIHLKIHYCHLQTNQEIQHQVSRLMLTTNDFMFPKSYFHSLLQESPRIHMTGK